MFKVDLRFGGLVSDTKYLSVSSFIMFRPVLSQTTEAEVTSGSNFALHKTENTSPSDATEDDGPWNSMDLYIVTEKGISSTFSPVSDCNYQICFPFVNKGIKYPFREFKFSKLVIS